ncbi:hypothetical protein [Arsenicibacter rosenii]|uniref:hypothetical protein n=1 Tax=Arsenicibacter rosenii TaxID=1750698 RepID=UPI0011603E7C|nr:hypothetical protein [Arsenicibacter rosenii]
MATRNQRPVPEAEQTPAVQQSAQIPAGEPAMQQTQEPDQPEPIPPVTTDAPTPVIQQAPEQVQTAPEPDQPEPVLSAADVLKQRAKKRLTARRLLSLIDGVKNQELMAEKEERIIE